MNKKVLKELLQNATTNEEKEKIIYEYMKQNRKDFSIKQLTLTLSSISASLLSITIIYIIKELFRK